MRLLLILLLLVPSCSLALDSFPGAVGVGKNTVGGRGGAVIHVTNLNDSGAGSLREAVTTSGARTVVFDVSGNIDLTSILSVNQPYITIAGQTSPGGISISGKQFNISVPEVIVRHMRFRSGGHRYIGNDSDGDSLSIWGRKWNGGTDVYNVVIDHCSITWGVDETFSVTGGAENITIQNSMVAGGLWYAKLGTGIHSKGLMVSGKNDYDTEVSLYKNYIAHNYDRSPLISNPYADNTTMQVEYVNNVSYKDKTYPDDWPTYSTANDNPTDTDSDGMPDTWETSKGLNISVANNNAFNLDENYTDIEYYINELAGDDFGTNSDSLLGGISQFSNIGSGATQINLN